MISDGIADVHINAVQQSTIPPYSYTLGLTTRVGRELICAGALRYDVRQVASILRACAAAMIRIGPELPGPVSVDGLGDFVLGNVHEQWLAGLMPAEQRDRSTDMWNQILPIRPSPTIDVPDLSVPPSPEREPAWRWLDLEWDMDVPRDSHLVTTLGVLSGRAPVTIFRWEVDQWEALDVPAADIDRADARVTPLGVLTAIVENWSPFLRLGVGEGMQLAGGKWSSA